MHLHIHDVLRYGRANLLRMDTMEWEKWPLTTKYGAAITTYGRSITSLEARSRVLRTKCCTTSRQSYNSTPRCTTPHVFPTRP
ncbi:Protein of unknown function [Pyronema omphalodes CBS 100304]|uniref:Uncharacterized protein n=1 Tax=Pyronema omphalodes (strain CBS 100304) TaxID=1076935 RepID=U4LV76_PYROM|nr:Protein of unknown function [Pyronema omphalodes CBS 100304]